MDQTGQAPAAGAPTEETYFSTDTTGLPPVTPTPVVELQDGAIVALRISSVVKQIGDTIVRMLAYNGAIPGPTLRVPQGAEITVAVTNDGDTEATVHWHGLRLENRYDGVPYDTQAPIPIGGTFTYRVRVPDAGVYWYHPHVREDYGLEMGLYGTIIVEPADPQYWPAVDRSVALTLDDILIEDGQIAPFRRSGPTFTAMGRFGNVLLINGETQFSDTARLGEVVRLYLVNTANTRIFNVAVNGARMKLVGGDSGRYEHETFVDEVLLAPSERAVVDVLFDTPGTVRLEQRTPERVYTLGTVAVAGTAGSDGVAARSFAALRSAPELTAERETLQQDLTREPDKVLAFVASMPLLYGDHPVAASAYACPMHPEVTATEPGRCPKCGMTLVPVQTDTAAPRSYTCPMHAEVTASEPGTCPRCGMRLVLTQEAMARPTSYVCPMHPDVTATEPGQCPKCGMTLVPGQTDRQPSAPTSYTCPMHPDVTASEPGVCPICGMTLVPAPPAPLPTAEPHHGQEPMAHGHGAPHEGDGLEWEDLMPEINRRSDASNMHWKIIDRHTGAENGAITWVLHVGERVKIRLVNEMESDHPMHHPFHIHGAGRFLILSRDGQPESNLVWKDTVLVRAGQSVDILLDVTNRGLWMAHCHIAEHAQSGMMFSFDVR